MEIKNCAAIVSGGGSGMGAATAKMLSAAGAKVALFDINLAAAKKVAAELNCLAIECDVTQEDSVKKAIEAAQIKQGPARICINCAGVVKGQRMIGREGPLPLDEFL